MQTTSLAIRESRGLPVKTPACQPQQIGDESIARAGCKYYDSEQGEVGRSRSKPVVISLSPSLYESFLQSNTMQLLVNCQCFYT